MHQVADAEHDGEDCRNGVLRLDGESEKEYIKALTEDYTKSAERIKEALGTENKVFTYPHGKSSELSEAVLHSLGVKVTVGTVPGVSELVRGIPQSLYMLKRFNVYSGLSPDDILALIESNS
jgi:hypothetical protein